VASSEGQIFFSLPLDAREGFLLSRIDGVLSEDALRELTGLGRAFVANSLDKFWSLGLIDFDAPIGAPKSAPPAPAPASAPVGAAVIAEGDDLTPDQRLWCESTSIQLESCTHYELLGVPVDADRKTVKRAYYALASRCHPDRFFRKNLGSYKLRLEQIFGRITLAHDTLTSRKQREAYDRYLADTQQARAIEDALSAAGDGDGDGDGFDIGEAPTEPRFVAGTASTASLLARRLLGKRQDSEPPPGVADRSSPLPEQAMDTLKRRYHQRTEQARRAQASKYEKQGDEATARGDWVAAANAYRIAIHLTPEDPEVLVKQQQGQRAADLILYETYERQANYEEKSGNFREAARNWCRVARIKTTDAHAHDRAAHALVRSDGDLHLAKELGMRAVELDPNAAAYRITLANVYLAAGLPLNARRELLTAKQFAPQDPTVSAMLRRIAQST
jgi:curved DNA-binding protein CbpA